MTDTHTHASDQAFLDSMTQTMTLPEYLDCLGLAVDREELIAMPCIHSGHFNNFVYDDGLFRVSWSREQGSAVTIEQKIKGNWYIAIEERA